MRKRDFYHTGLDISRSELAHIRNPNPSGAQDYYVDLNNIKTGGGTGSIDDPYSTLAAAIAASNLSIANNDNRWWARRNRIFVMGDGIAETITVLPEKTDIIGVGTDLSPLPRITGVWTIAAATVGVRFINLGFTATGTAKVLDLPAACHGTQILDCVFTATAAGNTTCIEITDSAKVLIQGNKIYGHNGASSTGVFAICIGITGTSAIHELNIIDNYMIGTAGIQVAAGTLHGSFIDSNVIRTVGGLAIADASSDVVCVDNRFLNSNANLAESGFCTWNSALAVGNEGSSDGARSTPVPEEVVLTS